MLFYYYLFLKKTVYINPDTDAEDVEAHGSSKVLVRFCCQISPTYLLAMFQIFPTFFLL